MIYALTLVAPVVLLGLLLVMERVEQPLRRDAVGERLVDFLDSARPEEVETFVSEGFAPALERYWSRRRSMAARRTRIEAAAQADDQLADRPDQQPAVRPAARRDVRGQARSTVRGEARRDVPVG